MQTLLGIAQALQRFDAQHCAVGTHRTLQRLNHMRQLHPGFIKVLHAYQLLRVQVLHVPFQRLLGAQALRAQYQHQQQQRRKAQEQFVQQRKALKQSA
ncbi:hypothetical protein D3C77_664550 [compost metagenome]